MEKLEQENRYFNQIEKCQNELDSISVKVNMIKDNTIKDGGICETVKTYTTELERRLNMLYERIVALNDNIII